MDGRYRLVDFGEAHVAALRAGKVILTQDVANDALVTQAEREMNLMLQILAYINVPLVKSDKLICLLGVNQSAPRQWTPLTLKLVLETAERTWAAVARAKAEIKIQQSEKQFKDMIEAIPQLVWVCNAAGEAIYFNEQWYQLTETTAAESLGNNWINLLHPHNVAETLEKWDHAQKTGTEFIVEYRLKTGKGDYRWMLSRGVPIMDINGNVERWFGTCTDIHERKTFAEELEKKVQERTIELNESNRLLQSSNEELQQFAYVSSHDLQEPLRKIRTFSSMALEHFNEEDMVKLHLSKINSSAARMSSLINDILRFSQASEGARDFETLDLNYVLEEVKVDFELLINQKQAKVENDRLPLIKANRLQITQLFSNLISNALKFSNGTPLVIVRYEEIQSHQIPQYVSSDMKQSYHYLRFSDNGIGFQDDYAEHIFKLFTRLHSQSDYKGTGIGLALCKKIVENHYGFIHATSEKGTGSSFHIYLPTSG